jgi:hypothetical protein
MKQKTTTDESYSKFRTLNNNTQEYLTVSYDNEEELKIDKRMSKGSKAH